MLSSVTRISFVALAITCFPPSVDSYSDDWEIPNDIFGTSQSTCGPKLDEARAELTECQEQLDHLRTTNKCTGPRIVKQPSVADHYLKRFINVLLSSADFKNRKLGVGQRMEVLQNLLFTSETLSVLQAFASDDTNGHSWTELDIAFISLFDGKAPMDNFNEETDSGDGFTQQNHLPLVVGAVCSFALCVIWLFLVSSSLKSSLYVAGVILFSTSFGWCWWTEFEHARMQFMVELSKTQSGLPTACINTTHGWLGWFRKSEREQECLEYLKARNIHPMVTVDMNHVMTRTLTLFFSWLPALATSVSKSIDAFYGDSWVGSATGYSAKLLSGPLVFLAGLLVFFGYVVMRSTFVVKVPGFFLGFGKNPTGVEAIQAPRQAQQVALDRAQLPYSTENGLDVKKRKKPKEKAPQVTFRTQPKQFKGEKSQFNWWLMTNKLKKIEDKRFRELRRAADTLVETASPLNM